MEPDSPRFTTRSILRYSLPHSFAPVIPPRSHSWGVSETVAFARELGQRGIPVLVTIQVDSIAKPGQCL